MRRNYLLSISAAIILSWTTTLTTAQAHTPAEAMAQAAQSFLASLTAEQQAAAQFKFDDAERLNWQFIPMKRKGLSLKEMKSFQQQLAFALLHSSLSHRGTSKALNIMALEQILAELENNPTRRDASLYHVFIFGEPSTTQTWGFRVEGHHLSVSLTLVDGQKIVGTPSFYGANPGKVLQGPHKGLRVLAAEEDLGRDLVKSLDAEQRKVAVIDTEAPADVINGPGRKASLLEPQGLAGADMTAEQRKQLVQIVREYVFNLRPELARADMKKIREAGIRKLHFAWAGGLEPGVGHYYRVQGPTFILEYDNTQNNANHIHCVWRDFTNDFGEDLLKQHHQAAHQEK